MALIARRLGERRLMVPVAGMPIARVPDSYHESRSGGRTHNAVDILAPRGTPVLAADDGKVAKLFRSDAGGITVYQYDRDERFIYYYAHLDRYAKDLAEGQILKRGQVLGYVGSSGNAPPSAPHLHFSIFKLGADKRWWKGSAVNPFPYLTGSVETTLARQGSGGS